MANIIIETTKKDLIEIYSLLSEEKLLEALVNARLEVIGLVKQLHIQHVDYQREQLADEPMIKFEMKSKILGADAYTHPNIKG